MGEILKVLDVLCKYDPSTQTTIGAEPHWNAVQESGPNVQRTVHLLEISANDWHRIILAGLSPENMFECATNYRPERQLIHELSSNQPTSKTRSIVKSF